MCLFPITPIPPIVWNEFVSDDNEYFAKILDLHRKESTKQVALKSFWNAICFNRKAMDRLFLIATEGLNIIKCLMIRNLR